MIVATLQEIEPRIYWFVSKQTNKKQFSHFSLWQFQFKGFIFTIALWSLTAANAAGKLSGFWSKHEQTSDICTASRFPMSEQFNTSAWNYGSVGDMPNIWTLL